MSLNLKKHLHGQRVSTNDEHNMIKQQPETFNLASMEKLRDRHRQTDTSLTASFPGQPGQAERLNQSGF